MTQTVLKQNKYKVKAGHTSHQKWTTVSGGSLDQGGKQHTSLLNLIPMVNYCILKTILSKDKIT